MTPEASPQGCRRACPAWRAAGCDHWAGGTWCRPAGRTAPGRTEETAVVVAEHVAAGQRLPAGPAHRFGEGERALRQQSGQSGVPGARGTSLWSVCFGSSLTGMVPSTAARVRLFAAEARHQALPLVQRESRHVHEVETLAAAVVALGDRSAAVGCPTTINGAWTASIFSRTTRASSSRPGNFPYGALGDHARQVDRVAGPAAAGQTSWSSRQAHEPCRAPCTRRNSGCRRLSFISFLFLCVVDGCAGAGVSAPRGARDPQPVPRRRVDRPPGDTGHHLGAALDDRRLLVVLEVAPGQPLRGGGEAASSTVVAAPWAEVL